MLSSRLSLSKEKETQKKRKQSILIRIEKNEPVWSALLTRLVLPIHDNLFVLLLTMANKPQALSYFDLVNDQTGT